nr:zinc finger, CCHC-type [Tanacetum cinerariifolium]
MHFLLTTLRVLYVLTTLMPGLMEDDIVEAIRRRSKMLNRLRSCKKDFKHTLKHGKDDLSLVQLGSHLRIEESLRAQDSKKGKGKEVGGPSVNMTEEGGKNKNNKQNKGKKRGFNENNDGSGSNKKPKLESPDDSGSVYMSSSIVVNSSLSHDRLGHVQYKRMLEMSKDDLIPAIDENPKNVLLESFMKLQILTHHSKMVWLKGKIELLRMVNSMLSYSGLSEEFWEEAMLKACYLLNRGCRVVVRLPEPKRKTLSEKGIDCIFVGYIEHSKAYRFYVIEPNDSVSINSIIESRDTIFDENPFSLIPRLKEIIPNSNKYQRDDHSTDVPSETPKPRKAIQSQDAAFWKEAIDDEIGSIMENNTWVLFDLPPGNEHKVCKLVKSLYGLKQAPKQWHQKFDEVVLSSGFLLNQSNKCVYSKFDDSGKGVIICLYVDDMLIFGTDQNQVDKTKKFLSSRFSMKDMGEANVILSIKIKHENKWIVITQSHYIKKILKKFNREDCSLVSLLVILVDSIDMQLQGYSDSSSTSGWVSLLGGSAISWASKSKHASLVLLWNLSL